MRHSYGVRLSRRGPRPAAAALLVLAGAASLTVAGCAAASSSAPGAASSTGPAASPRTAAAGGVVPPSATVLTLSLSYGMNSHGRRPPTIVTITNPETTGKVAGLIDRLPPTRSATYNCPVDDAEALDLTFRAQPNGPVLASANLKLNGCQVVALTVGKHDYARGNPGGARSTAAQVLSTAGVPWKLPPFLHP